MDLFRQGQAQIMVATTVIEVGLDIPNASVMVIESAERFGLSQLHQLRGRVGRGADQSYCILMTSHKLSADATERINTMIATSDGFEIAEVDLRMRGPGDLEGTQQSGMAFDLKIADLGKDGQILNLARSRAEEILAVDPELSLPENKVLRDDETAAAARETEAVARGSERGDKLRSKNAPRFSGIYERRMESKKLGCKRQSSTELQQMDIEVLGF